MTAQQRTKRILPGIGFVLALLVLGYLALRPFAFNYGASAEEVARAMPADTGGHQWTRAITIDAAPEAIWPWLVQFGQGRGGWYSYDWLENLFGLDIHSAAQVMPELQDPQLGQEICMGRGFCVSKVSLIEPNRFFGWQALGEDGSVVWAFTFGLYPQAGGSTRLVVRESFGTAGMPMAALVALEGPDLVMEQKMLATLKGLAEGRPSSPLTTPLEIGAWLAMLALGGVAGVRVLNRPRWQPSLALGSAALLILLGFTFLFPPLWLRWVLVAAIALALAYLNTENRL